MRKRSSARIASMSRVIAPRKRCPYSMDFRCAKLAGFRYWLRYQTVIDRPQPFGSGPPAGCSPCGTPSSQSVRQNVPLENNVLAPSAQGSYSPSARRGPPAPVTYPAAFSPYPAGPQGHPRRSEACTFNSTATSVMSGVGRCTPEISARSLSPARVITTRPTASRQSNL